VPIWRSKYDAGVREMQARFDAAHRQIEGRGNRLETDMKTALYTYRDSHRKVALYGDTLLPLARQTLATTERAYTAGSAGFSDLIDAQRVLLEFALAYERAAADRSQAAARIQALVGRTTDGGPAGPKP
jgi:outer membrane protein, heavy metal efflux system